MPEAHEVLEDLMITDGPDLLQFVGAIFRRELLGITDFDDENLWAPFTVALETRGKFQYRLQIIGIQRHPRDLGVFEFQAYCDVDPEERLIDLIDEYFYTDSLAGILDPGELELMRVAAAGARQGVETHHYLFVRGQYDPADRSGRLRVPTPLTLHPLHESKLGR